MKTSFLFSALLFFLVINVKAQNNTVGVDGGIAINDVAVDGFGEELLSETEVIWVLLYNYPIIV